MFSGANLEVMSFWFGVIYIGYMAVFSNRYKRLEEGPYFRRHLIIGAVAAAVFVLFGTPYMPMLIPISFVLLYKLGDWISFVYQGRHLIVTNRYVFTHDDVVKYSVADIVLSAVVVLGAAVGIPFIVSSI